MIRHTLFRGPGAQHAMIWVDGDVDRADAAMLESLRDAVRGASHVHVDLSEVGRVSVVLVSWLVDLKRQVQASRGRVTSGPTPKRLREMLERLGLSDLVDDETGADRRGTRDAAPPDATSISASSKVA